MAKPAEGRDSMVVVVVRVRHSGKQVMDVMVPCGVEGPADLAMQPTVADLRRVISQNLRIPVAKQRLLGSSRKWSDDTTPLVELGGVLVDRQPNGTAATPLLPPNTAAHVMVLGAAEPVAGASEATVPGPASPRQSVETGSSGDANLSTQPLELNDAIYHCSYSTGHMVQQAYYCRTCADEGWADPAHFICYACAEVCHASHTVEEWGTHNALRCDCPTATCCTPKALEVIARTAVPMPATRERSEGSPPPQPSSSSSSDAAEMDNMPRTQEGDGDVPPPPQPRRCAFVVSESTGEVPAQPAPRNTSNRYPSEVETWCFCRGADATDDEMEEGVNCMSCHNVFYAAHIRSLHVDLFRLVSCYAEVFINPALGFRCLECDPESQLVYCAPCIVHCHAGHRIAEAPELIDGPSVTGIEATQPTFQCGCRASCSLAHNVPDHVLLDPTAVDMNRLRRIATDLVESDGICGFLCADCMRRMPWLWRHNGDLTTLRQCRHGNFPIEPFTIPPPSGDNVRRADVVACKSSAPTNAVATAEGVTQLHSDPFPYHGMVVPDDIAMFLCPCEACQAALKVRFPRCDTDAEGKTKQHRMCIALDNHCHHCGERVLMSEGYLCATCEMWQENSCLLCSTCFEKRHPEDPVEAHSRSVAADLMSRRLTSDGGSLRSGNGDSTGVTAAMASTTRHEFVKETFENIWQLFGASIVQHVDRETKQWMLQHWNDPESREMVLAWMRDTFAGRRPTPGSATEGRKRPRSDDDVSPPDDPTLE